MSFEDLWSRLWATRFGPNDVRLRFELGGEFDDSNEQVPRFLQAHRRASAIADALFHEGCIGIAAWNGRRPCPAGLDDGVKDAFEAFRSTGFQATQIGEWRAELYPADDDDAYIWNVRSYDLGQDKTARDTLIWHAIAYEMPIHPSAPVITFLLDPVASVMLHIYDDRGLDVIALDADKLRGIYDSFADWLLDYDLERMRKLF